MILVEAKITMKKVLVIGGGAREHAICDAVHRSQHVTLYSIMKNVNPGIKQLAKEFGQINETNIAEVVRFADKHEVDLVFIGPEAPLEAGLTDALQEHNIAVCAPTKDAARIETDKEWMRNILEKYNINGQLQYKSFNSIDKARAFIEQLQGNVVLKPIGLTGGKGVKVAGDHFTDTEGAIEYITHIFEKKIGGEAKVVIEEKAVGEEFTIQAFSDGKTIKPFPAVQDHKRLYPSDEGPNTGGMGSYSDKDGLLPFLNRKEYDTSVRILKKIISALSEEGCPFVGPIYGQFMLTVDGPKVIEINARFGDPEAMNILPLLQTDFIQISNAILNQTLDEITLRFDKKSTVCKYVVPEGYGEKSVSDKLIRINADEIKNSGALLFYASVNQEDENVKTTSSRSLAVIGHGETITEAESVCEDALRYIHSDHIYIRHDIGTPDLIKQRIEHMNQLRGVKQTV